MTQYQIFSSLRGHLHFSVHFFFTFLAIFFKQPHISLTSSFVQLPEHELVVLIWSTLMGTVEWNRKEDLVADQALEHLKVYTPLFAK